MPIALDGRTDKEMQTKIFNNILFILDKYQVKAAGFVVGRKRTEQYHLDLLKEFVKEDIFWEIIHLTTVEALVS